MPAIPAPTITTWRPPRAATGRRATGSTRTAHAFSSGCLEIGSIAREVTAFSAPAPGVEVQRAPVERRERDAARHGRRSPAARSTAARAASARAPGRRRAAPTASSGCSSTNGSGSALEQRRRLAGARHRVPLVRDAAGRQHEREVGVGRIGRLGVRRRREARAAVGGREAPRRVEPLGARGDSARGHGHCIGPSRRSRACERPVWSHSRPVGRLHVLVVDGGGACARRTPRGARARARRARRSPSPAAPRRAGRARAARAPTRRSEFVIVPSFSGHCAAGRTTCASAPVSVGW